MPDALPLLFNPAPHPLVKPLCEQLPATGGGLSLRRFPDGESYLRIESPVRGRRCIVLADLSRPDAKYLPLIFLAATLRELHASSVGLLAPYLCYMCQDRRFAEGEALSSRLFATELCRHFDWLVTVDPHLHRYRSLEEIYTIPTRVVQGAAAVVDWLKGRENLFLVGPDAESGQWVSRIADASGHPWVVGSKVRRGDREVSVSLPPLDALRGRDAVIVDDVISSGHTVLECLKALRAQDVAKVDCACVHGIFADGIDAVLRQQGLRRLASTNTIPHASNSMDVSFLLLPALREFVFKQ